MQRITREMSYLKVGRPPRSREYLNSHKMYPYRGRYTPVVAFLSPSSPSPPSLKRIRTYFRSHLHRGTIRPWTAVFRLGYDEDLEQGPSPAVFPPGYAGENCGIRGEGYSKIGAVAVWRSHAAGIGAARARTGIVWFCRAIFLMLDANRPHFGCVKTAGKGTEAIEGRAWKFRVLNFTVKLFPPEFDKDSMYTNSERYLDVTCA